jgi:hypothetical protein
LLIGVQDGRLASVVRADENDYVVDTNLAFGITNSLEILDMKRG